MIHEDLGSWLTAARIARLPLILQSIRSQPPPGLKAGDAARVAWRSCGGPLTDVLPLIKVSIDAGLVIDKGERLQLTRLGHRVVTQDRQHGGTMLLLELIRAGLFSRQARVLGEVSEVDSRTGDVWCRRSVAIASAPQLVGVLRRFPRVRMTDKLFVPASLAAELSDIWVLPDRSTRSEPRREIGDRAELYSYRFEQSRAADRSKIRWVASDDEGLGYDIEDLNSTPSRRIEVKGSSGTEVRLILSVNEWEVSQLNPDTYEVHFWGGVNPTRTPREEYVALTRAGFPLIFRNLHAHLAQGLLQAQPSQYVVTVPQAGATVARVRDRDGKRVGPGSADTSAEVDSPRPDL